MRKAKERESAHLASPGPKPKGRGAVGSKEGPKRENGRESSFNTKLELLVAPTFNPAREEFKDVIKQKQPKTPSDTQQITILNTEVTDIALTDREGQPVEIIANALRSRTGGQFNLHCAKTATYKGTTIQIQLFDTGQPKYASNIRSIKLVCICICFICFCFLLFSIYFFFQNSD